MSGVLTATPPAIAGATSPSVAGVIAAHQRLLEHSLRNRLLDAPITASGDDLRRYLIATMGDRRTERLRALYLDSGNRPITDEVVADGTPSGIWAEPRLILKRALELNAAALLVVHNHPGGQMSASEQDRRFTRALANASAPLGICLQDHLIVADDRCLSLRAEGLIQ